MSKKIYELSSYTQAIGEQRELKTQTGEIYNISFVPAMVNRKYYKRWTDIQEELRKELEFYHAIKLKLTTGEVPTDEDMARIEVFKKIAAEAAEAGTELIVYTLQKNGYDSFDEDELYENFSEADMAFSINFIMGIDVESVKEIKKNKTSKK